MAAYCKSTDLLMGNVPTPTYLNVDRFVNDAADEIDSKIGFLYETPVQVTGANAATRPVQLLLKRLNVFLATGRLLLAVDAGGEESQTHAYGLYLVKEADAALLAISKGEVVLEGAIKKDTSSSDRVNGPIIYNKDPESSVEAFYDRIANPLYLFPEVERFPGSRL